MTARHRHATIDAMLSPKQLILVWLEEAHQFPTITDYARSTLDQPRSPLSRILDEVSRGAGRTTKTRPVEELRKDVRRAQGDALFLYELVLRLNVVAAELSHLQGLRIALLRLQLLDLLANPILNERSKEPAELSTAAALDDAWQSMLGATRRVLEEVHIEEGARLGLERRYLDGRPVLFPGVVGDWATLEGQAEDLATLLGSLPDKVGRKTRRPAARAAATPSVADRILARARDVADDARVEALLRLGDRDTALLIEERRLRTMAAPPPGPAIRQ